MLLADWIQIVQRIHYQGRS